MSPVIKLRTKKRQAASCITQSTPYRNLTQYKYYYHADLFSIPVKQLLRDHPFQKFTRFSLRVLFIHGNCQEHIIFGTSPLETRAVLTAQGPGVLIPLKTVADQLPPKAKTLQNTDVAPQNNRSKKKAPELPNNYGQEAALRDANPLALRASTCSPKTSQACVHTYSSYLHKTHCINMRHAKILRIH